MTTKSCLLGMLIFLVACLSLGTGCTRPKGTMKIPNIKVITKEDVHGIMAPDDSNIWIVGDYGVIYHSSDGGQTWSKQNSGIAEGRLIDGCFVDSTTGWVVGHYGVILHTEDGGATWTRQNSATDKHLFSVSFVDRDYGWAVGEWAVIMHTTDGGQTWVRQGEEEDKIFNNIAFVDRLNGWIVGEAGLIKHTTDGGQTWAIQMPKVFERATEEELFERQRPALFSACFTSPTTGFLSGMDGCILRTTDAGTTWDQLPTNTSFAIYTVFVKGDQGWAVGDRGLYLASSDGGATWHVQHDVIKSKFWFRDVWFSSPQKGWVVGQGGTVVGSTDGGQTWEYQSGISYTMEFFRMPKALEFQGMVTE